MPVQMPSSGAFPGENSPPGSESVRNGTNPDGKRYFEFETVIDCPSADVWRAITEASEIAKWFAPEARVEPGPGGKIWVSWGPGWEGAQRIAVWEPGRRIGLNPWKDGDEAADADKGASGAVPVAVDYIIEAKGGQTVLRIVQSGFGPGNEWDGEVDAISRGWRIFMAQLKHGLERHGGKPGAFAWIDRCVAPLPDSWRKIIGPGSPLTFSELDSNCVPAPGSRFTASAGGETFTGRVEFFGPSREFGVVLDDPKDGLFRLSILDYGAWTGFSIYLIGYGKDADRQALNARALRFHEALIAQLGIGVDPPEHHPSYQLMREAREAKGQASLS